MDTKAWAILNWNVRDSNDPVKWDALRKKINESVCNVICIQESKREVVDIKFIRNFSPKRFDALLSNLLLAPGVALSPSRTVVSSRAMSLVQIPSS